MKTSCDIYKEKGDYYFQNEYYFFISLHDSCTSWAQPWLESSQRLKKARLKDTM